MNAVNTFGITSIGFVLIIYGLIGLGLWFSHKKKWREVTINPKTKARYSFSGLAVFWILYIFINWMNHKYDGQSPTGETAPTLLSMFFPIGLLFFIWIKSSRIAMNPGKEEILAHFGQTKEERRNNIEKFFDAKHEFINTSHSYLNVKGNLVKISAQRNLAVFNHKELNALRVAFHLLNEDFYTNVDYLRIALAIVAGEQAGQLTYSINGTAWNQFPEGTINEPPAEILKQYLSSLGFVGTTSVVDTALGHFLSFAKTPTTSKFYLELCEKIGIGDPVNNVYEEAAYEPAAD
ncbi:hypothetical protein RO575_13365 [Methylomonas sp. MO1]|uniref:hypothetical protein n=1 Tax=unclassified Methylomonas TaxID=2608980 RepID=UPI000479B503|nr:MULTISPECIES: hypothetical protein [unclassified Methylomonas]MDT4290549.1 hypothetical protein [Methylomonas sp. MO1]